MLTHTRSMVEVGDSRVGLGERWMAQTFRRAMKRAGQLRCGITGHDVLLRYEPKRLSLQCTSCGYESPGWELDSERAPGSHAGAGARFSPPMTVTITPCDTRQLA
jgi:hypothetical protein